MTNIFLGIALTFFTAALVLQIIGTLKEIRLMTMITKPFLMSMTLVSFILLIKDFLPDSIFLMIFGIVSLSLAFSGNVLFMFNLKGTKIAGTLAFIVSILSMLFITFPSFRLFTPHIIVTIIYSIVITALAICLFVLCAEKNVLTGSLYFLFFIAEGIYLYSTIITLYGEKKLYAIFMVLSSLLLGAAGVFLTKKEADKNPPLYNFLTITLCTVSYALEAAACILMQAL